MGVVIKIIVIRIIARISSFPFRHFIYLFWIFSCRLWSLLSIRIWILLWSFLFLQSNWPMRNFSNFSLLFYAWLLYYFAIATIFYLLIERRRSYLLTFKIRRSDNFTLHLKIQMEYLMIFFLITLFVFIFFWILLLIFFIWLSRQSTLSRKIFIKHQIPANKSLIKFRGFVWSTLT